MGSEMCIRDREIAEVTNCPVGTVRSRIFRAREEIINYFKEEVNERD